ncbi:hypothetical protein QZH41_017276, partial [Actinostola sp. cb2023]
HRTRLERFSLLAILVIMMFLWQLSQGSTCDTWYTQSGFALRNHVIQTSKSKDLQGCTDKCAANDSCNSINIYESGQCELNNGNHLTFPDDLLPHQAATYLLYSAHPLPYCSKRYCSDGEICVMNTDGINYRCQKCGDPLGMEDGRINDSQITASSLHSNYYYPWYARLRNNRGWAPKISSSGEYLQIDLRNVLVVSGVATQKLTKYELVTKYFLQHSVEGSSWTSYQHGQQVQ